MKFLLDTCVISELAAKRPEPRVVTWIDSIDPDRIYLSVVTVGEIQKGIEKQRDPAKKERLEGWLQDDLLVRFRDRLVELDLKAMLEWGTLTGRLESQGSPMPAVDSLIAASALLGGFVLVTRNEEDFIRSGVQILNPWN
ncbi:MAG TPA: type II toxin-antitoxin system VapC family toxin [Thermoanaerobaculia bacterium]